MIETNRVPDISPRGVRRYTYDTDWLARHDEPTIEPDLPIIDPHHHLWDRSGSRYGTDELRADLDSGHNVVATVYIQCFEMHNRDVSPEMAPLGETEYVNGVAAFGASGRDGFRRICAGIVGHADLRLGSAVEGVLHAHLRAAERRFRGIRHISAWDGDENLRSAYRTFPGLLADSNFRDGFACLEPLGLSFDAWLYHPQIGELTDLARAFPETTIILDHFGGVLGIGAYAGRRDEIFQIWSSDIRELSSCPNVVVKLGGLLMPINGFGLEDGESPPTSAQAAEIYRPYFDVCLEAFGPDRCMFESNFPVDKGSISYPVFWNACKRLAVGYTADEKSALFSGTAERVYRLILPERAN